MIAYINKPVSHSRQVIDTMNNENKTGDGPGYILSSECIASSHGFIVTAFAFEEFLTYNSLHYSLHSLMQLLDAKNYSNISAIVDTAQSLLLSGKIPPSLRRAIVNAYHELGINEPVLVHSHSFTVNNDRPQEDLYAQHENALTVFGEKNILAAVQNCFAALYTEGAIKYRQDNGLVHDKATMSVTVHKMQRLPQPVLLRDPQSLN